MNADQELDRLRAAMDVCNRRLAAVLHERASLARRIGAWKRQHGQPLADLAREATMLEQVRQLAGTPGFEAEALVRIFAVVLAESRAIVERG